MSNQATLIGLKQSVEPGQQIPQWLLLQCKIKYIHVVGIKSISCCEYQGHL